MSHSLKQQNRARCFILGAGMFGAALTASAEPCQATAVIAGEPVLVGQISSMLASRDIVLSPAAGCPALWAEVSVTNHTIVVTLQDASGKAETFQVVEAATAAALIEAWSRAELGPLLPPGVDSSSEDAASFLSDMEAAAPASPNPPQVVQAEDPPLIQAAARPALDWRRLLLGRSTAALPQRGLQVSGEYIDAGFRLEGRGISVSTQIPHQRFPKFQLSGEGRAYEMVGVPPVGSMFVDGDNAFVTFSSQSNSGTELPIAKTLYQGADGLLRLARPLSWWRVSLTPSVAAGFGMTAASGLLSNVSLPTVDATQELVECQLSASVRLGHRIALNVFGSLTNASTNATLTDYAFVDEGLALEPAPTSYERVGAGFTYQFRAVQQR